MLRLFILGLLLPFTLSFANTKASTIQTQLKTWKAQGVKEGWTFKVGDTPMLHIPEPLRTGYDPEVNARAMARVEHVIPPMNRIPEKWDWRDQNAIGPVKDQAYPQYCGSCWAFGTVSVVEAVIKIATGRDVDISEQQLVSCKPDYGSCSGGNFAFGFYTQKGAAYESDFPYKASDVSCKSGLPENEKIDSFAYLGEKGRGPTVDEMKSAIYNYGPIAVTVSASGAWNGYKSGIYNACNSNSINHIVSLVGYDDADQVWILRNSHGTQFGEQGYMRIKYVGTNGHKCNNVGDEAVFARYKP